MNEAIILDRSGKTRPQLEEVKPDLMPKKETIEIVS
jgi:hypothetical protein